MTKLLSWLTVTFVLLLSVASFILSYNALREVSLSAIAPRWSWLWPLVIDGAIVVFALVVVHFSLIKHKNIVPTILVFVFAGITVLFNAIHAGDSGLSVAVGIMPPLALVLSFEVFVWMVKSGIERREVGQSLGQLRQARDKLRTEIDKLETRQGQVRDKLTELRTKIKEEGTTPGQPLVIVGVDVDTLRHSPDKRLPVVGQLLDNNVPRQDIVTLLGISTKTLSRDIKVLENRNGKN